jgi:hypothetical protein
VLFYRCALWMSIQCLYLCTRGWVIRFLWGYSGHTPHPPELDGCACGSQLDCTPRQAAVITYAP